MPKLRNTVDLLAALADPTRVRLLALLAHDAFSVAELTRVLGLAQSRVSAHLARLRSVGLLDDERRGTATLYSLANGSMPPDARALWTQVSTTLDDKALDADRRRARSVIEARRDRTWPERVAGEMDRHYSPGRTWESLARALAVLVDLGRVIDIGAGDGSVASLIAARSKEYVCIDASETMVDAAKARLGARKGLRFVVAHGEALPERDATFDTALLFNVLAHATDPGKMLGEAARVLRPGGRLAVVTLAPHDALAVAGEYGHRHAGFAPTELADLLVGNGLDVATCGVTSRETKPPFFEVVTALGIRRAAQTDHPRPKRTPRRSSPVGAS